MQVAYKELGEGPPLLLINGYGATKDDWDPTFVETLAGSSRVICPDNRDIGDSGAGDKPLSIESMARDMIELADSLQIESIAVAGWSMGGFISQQLAADAPDRVSSLVLLSTDPGGSIAEPRDAGIQKKLTDHSGTPHERARRLLELLFPPAMAIDIYERFGDLVADAQARLTNELLEAQEKAMEEWSRSDAESRLSSITAPALVAAGSEDIVIPPVNAELISARLTDSWLIRFQGAAHALMAQEPQRLGQLINLFLGR
jgi:pimeloyl-ACP methyl ester carboxylesterase